MNPELEARILAQPEIEAFRIYGDWFADRGDPRGDLVALQVKLMTDPESRALRKREKQLLDENSLTWLGSFAAADSRDFRCSWFCGFIDWASIGSDNVAGKRDLAEMIDQLAQLPCIGLLRALSIGKLPEGTSYAKCVDALARNAHRFVGLTKLAVAGKLHALDGTQSSIDLGPACEGLAKLQTLTLVVDWPNLAKLDLQALRTLDVCSSSMHSGDLAAFAKPWRSLERLAIAFGVHEYRPSVYCAMLDPLLQGHRGVAKLAHLALTNVPFGDELADALASSQLLPKLKTLDLSGGELSSTGRRVLRSAAFAHLEEIRYDED